MYRFPCERTASVRIYSATQSFYDFGRNCGGDCVRLWSHVKGCDSWTALNEIRETFGLNAPNKQHCRDLIREQEETRQRQLEAQNQAKRRWVREVDALKTEASFYRAILESEHCRPLSWLWCTCQNRLTIVQIQLDLLCGV